MASKPGFSGGHMPVLTLLISLNQRSNNLPTWGPKMRHAAEDHFSNGSAWHENDYSPSPQ